MTLRRSILAVLVGVVVLAAGLLAAPASSEQAGSEALALQAGLLDGGGSHTCVLLGGGGARCWGDGSSGQLGYGNTTSIGDDEPPGSVGPVDLGAGRGGRAIAAGTAHTCALLDNGAVRCWGLGDLGRLGYGNTTTIGDNETPGTVGPVNLGAGRTAGAITAGFQHSCALLDNGAVRCWGAGVLGRLGYGNNNDIGDNETPGSVGPVDLGAGRTAQAITAGLQHTCALLDNGAVRCWGNGANGRLGYGNTTPIGDNETPGSVAPVDLGLGRTARAITAGSEHTCALLDNGAVRCWGNGDSGRLGYGNTTTVGDDEPPGSVGPVDLGAGRTAQAITAGFQHTCALLDNGAVRCWGNGANGRLGYGNTTTVGDDEPPGSVGPVDLGAGHTARAITAGDLHTCALLDDGAVRCWGLGATGQLGYGNTNDIGDNEMPASVGPVNLVGRPAGLADLSLTVAASAAQRIVGEPVTFTVTVANGGPDPATGIRVVAALPDGLAFVSATPSQGSYDPAVGLWQTGALANPGTATLQIAATTTRVGARSLTAEVIDAGQPDPDSTPGNGLVGEDDQAAATVAVIPPPPTIQCGRSAGLAMRCSFAGPLPPDKTPPALTVSAPASLTVDKLLKGLTASATANEPARITFELLASARKATIAAARDLTLAFKDFPFATGTRTAKLKPSRALLGNTTKNLRLRLRTTATDAAGNATTNTKNITIKPAKKKRQKTPR